MKKLHLLLLSITLCVFSACHNDIWDAIDGLDSRVTKLEELCKEMNTNITSLQTIVDVLQSNDFITSIVEIKKDGKVVGYTITFGKHDPITIYHGQDGKDGADGKDGQDGTNGKDGQDGADGKDGQNGADGKDGSTPVIGVAQDTDGVYYWTLNGEWLLDDNGNKLPVTGKDGKDGQDGADGKDGQNGADGKDGQDSITPLLKIEDGYWYVSYDNGTTWTLMGKATGADGQNGQDGTNGADGKDGQDGADGQDGITPLLKIENGYWYISYDNGATWAQLGKATGEDGKDGANGTNGTDGKDGQDGADGSNGQDGITPQLKIENGYWYVSYDNGTTWTQFGKATGADGQDGQNGTDGKDGQDGKDGVTPQLKIEEGYWFISYDNGATWTQLGKATGEDGKDGADGEDGKDGQNGADGKDGQDGDSMFQSVTQDENYVYFTLADGTVIKIAKKTANTNPSNSFHNNREFIDLGLPSGTKWAKENVDGYYCFGGTSSNVLISDTIFINGKALAEGDSICGTVYDVATLEWGQGWQIPTESDFQELIDNCTVLYLSEEGMQLQSKINKKSIFFQFDVIPNAQLGGSIITYKWYGYYLSSKAYRGLYVEMSRKYDYYRPGYTEKSLIQGTSISATNFYLIRPVLKD